MPSLTNLTSVEVLSQSMEFIADALVECGFTVCSQQRSHTEPRSLHCCDDCGGDYALVGWVVRAFSSDADLTERASWRCPTLDSVSMGFTVARCWPETDNIPKTGGAMDATAVELLVVLDCLSAALGACATTVGLFAVPCIRFAVGDFTAEKGVTVELYGGPEDGGKVSRSCAGWRFSLTVA